MAVSPLLLVLNVGMIMLCQAGDIRALILLAPLVLILLFLVLLYLKLLIVVLGLLVVLVLL